MIQQHSKSLTIQKLPQNPSKQSINLTNKPQNPSSSLHQALQNMQHQVQTEIQSGIVTINQQSTPLSASRTSNKSQSRQSTPFYISSNPSIIRQKYNQFLELKQEYSHPKNEATMKEMQHVVKSWIKRQKLAQKKREQNNSRIEQQNLREIQMQQEQRRRSLQEKMQSYRQRLMDKMQVRKLRKQQEQRLMRADSISKQMLKQKQPLYKEQERKFNQQLFVEQQAKSMQLYWKKQSLAPYDLKNIKQHRLKLAKQLKIQSIQRIQAQGSPRRIKTESIMQITNPKSQFITTKYDRQIIQQEEQKKRIRIKQYVDRLKSMSPDQQTLERIKKVKEQITSTQKILHQNIIKRIQKTSNTIKKRTSSVRSLVDQKRLSKEDRVQMGNKYLKDQLKLKIKNKLKTQTKNNSTIQENPEQSSSIDQDIVKEILLQPQPKSQTISKPFILEQTTQTPQKKDMSLNRKNRQTRSLKTLPSKTQVSSRPQYKNYLPELKKNLKPQSQLEKTKKRLKNPEQIFKEFGRQSLELQRKLIKKINEFKRIQSTQKYQKNLHKEQEIDDLYHKNLQMKLACLSID